MAREAFRFLGDFGLEEIEATSLLEVRYRKGNIDVEVYLEPRSHEINADVVFRGRNYSLGQLIRAADKEIHRNFHYPAATTSHGVAVGLDKIALLFQQFATEALQGNPSYFLKLDELRKFWAKMLADEVAAKQTRPKAEEAWRKKDYAKAAELYRQIRASLSPAELQKLAYAEKLSR